MDEKHVSKKLLIKSSFWYVLSMFLTRSMAFITIPIFTRLMTKKDYGNFTVFATWQSILLIICSVDLYGTLNRARFDYPEKKDFRSYISSCLCLCTLITGTLFLAYIVFPHIFDRFFLLERRYMYIMFAYLFFVPAMNMFMTEQRINYRYKTSSALSIAATLSSPILGVALVVLMKDRDALLGRVIGQYCPYIILGIVFYAYYLCKSREISVSNWKYALRLGLPLAFSFLGSQILLSADLLVLKHMCTAEEVSYLSVTHSTSHIILILVQTLSIAWSPWLYDMLKKHCYETIKKMYNIFLWGMIFCTFGVLLVGPEVIQLLGGLKYRESIFVLPPNILCGIFTVLTAQFTNIEVYHKKPEYSAILTGGIAVVNIVLDVLGVKIWGYRAVCYTTVLCQILLIFIHYRLVQSLEAESNISKKTLFFSLAASLTLIPISLLLYQRNMIRYIFFAVVVGILVCILIIKRKECMILVRRIWKTDKEG